MPDKQTTIKSSVKLSGTGLHTGDEVTLSFNPAPANSGYRFKRTDLDGGPVIKADVDYVINTDRGTSLAHKGVEINTVEHVLAALSGLQIDNCLIEMNCSEPPILDGSSKYFVDILKKAGTETLNADREYLVLDRNIVYSDPDGKTELLAIPDEQFRASVMINFETKVLSTQNAAIDSIEEFKDQIAQCRTFVFLHELEFLLNNNLIRGGDLSNAIVFVNKTVTQEELDRLAGLFNKPSVKVLDIGILNNIDLYYDNEPARHKLLDVIGDLALVGKPIKGHIIARRPGHSANVELARLLKKHLKENCKNNNIPKVDLNQPPVYNIQQIQQFLPHRPPFLLVDRIMEMSDNHVIGMKNVTMNESFFVGHFPDEPVMPGVLQIEAMAQTGGILALNSVDNPGDYTTYFMKIDNVRFRQKVIPGDTIIFKLDLLSPIRRGLCHMKGVASVGNKIVMEAEMLAQVARMRK